MEFGFLEIGARRHIAVRPLSTTGEEDGTTPAMSGQVVENPNPRPIIAMLEPRTAASACRLGVLPSARTSEPCQRPGPD